MRRISLLKKIPFFLLIVLFVIPAMSQTRKFSQEESHFIKDMNGFLIKVNPKKGKKLMEKFILSLNSGYFGNLEKEDIFATCNEYLQKKHALAFPHFENYLTLIIAFQEKNIPMDNYKVFESYLLEIMPNKKITLRKTDKFIKNITDLINKNDLYYSHAVEWQLSNNNYQFQKDKKTFKIKVDKTNLTAYAKGDSSNIYETSGTYFPIENKWIGYGGKITWERAKLSRDQISAVLGRYQIEMKKSNFHADSVQFIYTKFFKKPIYGSLSEKVMDISKNKDPLYPQFQSYRKRFKFPNIFENIDFEGGFLMKGPKVYGQGSETEKAMIKVYYKDTLRVLATSKLFVLKPKQIISQNTAVSIYLAHDSIYHPGLIFKYNDNNKTIQFIRNNKGLTRAPYIDTYHQVLMDVNLISWDINVPKFDFTVTGGSTQHKAKFKSLDFFKIGDYLDIQKMDMQNPLSVIRTYAHKNGSDVFYDVDFANFLRVSIPQAKRYLLNVCYLGFIDYDSESGVVTVMPRLYNYLKASVGDRDYDVISFNSDVKGGNNAELSLLNYFMKIHGVPQIFLSDSQNVMIFPRNQEIVLKKNRNFDFDGKVRAGMFLFAGSHFAFLYDLFKIKMPDIAYMKMQVLSDEYDRNGMPVPVIVKNKIENVNGELLIDMPNNKSGVKASPQYPVFKSFNDSYVYFDSKKIQKGVYHRDKFYFQIYPYEMDSLDNFNRDNIQFDGYFVSGGIFPPFEESLKIQPDYSLGFVRKTAESGSPIYGGKSTFTNKIKLSNGGLRGDGKFEYLTSTSLSNNFIFFPDSMNAICQKFNNKEQKSGTEYPQVDGQNIYIHYLPQEDELFASNRKQPFNIMNKQATMTGTLTLRPEGLGGKGMMEFEKAQLYADNFKFKALIADADTSNFNLKTIDMQDFTFKTNNVNSHIDFVNRVGKFHSNGEASFVTFPQNKYICYMDQFTWYMDQEEIEMSTSKDKNQLVMNKVDTTNMTETQKEDIQLEGSKFISIHPKQDSLNFVAPSAKYNLRTNIITANKVKLIRVADATIYPGDGHVVIAKRAKMQTLKNSKITANNVTRYHKMYNCLTNIYGRKDYSANGDYDYLDENNQKETIHFDVISVDTSLQTYAKGHLGISDNFTLSPHFMYTGDVWLHANNQFLNFQGATKISHECDMQKRYWVKFKSDINPKDIYIPIGDTIEDINNNKLVAGFFLAHDSTFVYSAFLTTKKGYRDNQIVASKGFLYFDNGSRKYKIANKEKIKEFSLPGSYMSIHRSICNVYGEGKMNLGLDFGRVTTFGVGNINNTLADSTVSVNMLLGVDFFFNKNALEYLAKDLQNATALEPVDVNRDVFKKGLAELVGIDKSEELISQYAIKGQMKKIPKALKTTIFFNDLKFEWDSKSRSYISIGKIGIGNVGDFQINKFVDGHIILTKKRSGNVLIMYLQLGDGWWYYFEYARGVMRVVSSIDEFNLIITSLKPDDRRLKAEKGQKPYSYYPTNVNIVKKFLRQFEEQENDDSEDNGSIDNGN